jgi:glycosyltransferase involved in cell wall biosynthesis
MGERLPFRKRVCHLTSVHTPTDPRILYKECATLAANGYDVVLIAPHDRDEVVEGVQIRSIPPEATRLRRIWRSLYRIYRAARREECALYHFHDPELIPVGWLLRLEGRQVVYDIHEDYRTAILQKEYVPRPLRSAFAALIGIIEAIASRTFTVVLAERYYQLRFPDGKLVLNYPLNPRFPTTLNGPGTRNGPVRLIYTGNVTEDRGALLHAGLVGLRDDVEVHFIGRCSSELAVRMRDAVGTNRSRLFLKGEGFHVPYEEILHAYQTGVWTAGLALFPSTPHYREKELTKFFEYMAAGIPIICSRFPVWQDLVEKAGCGITVDPHNLEEIDQALDRLARDPLEAAAMGIRGRMAVERTYNWKHQGEGLIEIYRGLIGPATSVQ